MPIYSPHDILLIAADREAHHGERCVIEMNNNLFIVEKRTVVKNGVKMSEYVSLMNKRFYINDTEIDEKLGFDAVVNGEGETDPASIVDSGNLGSVHIHRGTLFDCNLKAFGHSHR